MNRKSICFCLLVTFFVLSAALKSFGQGTAFTYQGRLNDGGSPANGSYDLRFTLFDSSTNGNAIGLPQTNLAVAVSAGIFTTNVDFGPVFNGNSYWLSISVRTNGNTGAFTLLSPRQALLPVPYAIFANTASNVVGSVSATQLIGTLSSAQVAGTYGGSVNFTNSTNSFNGRYSGDGGNLTNLNGSAVAFGTVADARLSHNVALLNTNQTFTGTNIFTGTNTFTGANYFDGLNSFTNRLNAFTGSFFGNGLVGFIPTFGTATQAVANAGYLILNPKFTKVTLPPSGSVFAGDVVRVSGAGGGGWLAKVNAGQTILGNFASFQNVYPITPPNPINSYSGVAVTADGIRMFVVGSTFTGVLGSSDSGKNFVQVSSSSLGGSWNSIACSANGKTVYIAPSGSGTIQVSTDGGVHFTQYSSTVGNWQGISCTADGSKLFVGNVACSGDGTNLASVTGGTISVSTNGGTSWTAIAVPAAGVACLAASRDCTKIIAGVTNGLLYGTANQGGTWTALTATNQFWSGLSMTGDGSRFAGAVSTGGGFTGAIFYYGVQPQPDTATTNSIGGGRGDAVELQYNGNNQFLPISSTGLIWAN
ncbi:MAG TPA: hypothetical protein VG347_02015 [Verrucomicrobiae bacterium]|nr:hypothetical protein [Verrucomicrobiae bacterium]